MSHSKYHMPMAFEHVIIVLALHQVPMLHGLLSWVAGKQLGHIYLGTYINCVNLIPLNPGFKPAQPGVHLVAHHLVAKLLMMK